MKTFCLILGVLSAMLVVGQTPAQAQSAMCFTWAPIDEELLPGVGTFPLGCFAEDGTTVATMLFRRSDIGRAHVQFQVVNLSCP